jgi:hypothetical protein
MDQLKVFNSNSIIMLMRNLISYILYLQIKYQKNKMYRLSVKYGLDSSEVLEQSLVVDVLINRVMQRGVKPGAPLLVFFISVLIN